MALSSEMKIKLDKIDTLIEKGYLVKAKSDFPVPILISPEGTRTLTGEIGPFKKGPFHLAKNTNATIVPIALRGGFRAKRKNDWRLQPGVLTVVFGQPISSTSYKELDIKELRDLISKKIIELKKRG